MIYYRNMELYWRIEIHSIWSCPEGYQDSGFLLIFFTVYGPVNAIFPNFYHIFIPLNRLTNQI